MSKKLLTQTLSEPLGSLKTVKININPGDGNLIVDGLTDNGQVLASGTLQYLENQGLPMKSMDKSNGQATFNLKSVGDGGQF
jgi:hypothetical protein